MSWRSSEAARVYHERTKHSPLSVRTVPHFLDWANQPLAFKIYPGAEKAALVPVAEPARVPPTLTAETLSRLLFYTAGITKHLRSPRGRMPFRAAACTGALYHVEIYLVTGRLDGLEGLDAGVYHYDPRLHVLDRLRSGDFRGPLVEATGGEASA